MGGYDKDKAAAKRAEYMRQGLTSKGKPRKGRAKPHPHQHIVFSKKKAKPEPRKKVETPEQHRDRGRELHMSVLGMKIEERIQKRVKAMK